MFGGWPKRGGRGWEAVDPGVGGWHAGVLPPWLSGRPPSSTMWALFAFSSAAQGEQILFIYFFLCGAEPTYVYTYLDLLGDCLSPMERERERELCRR